MEKKEEKEETESITLAAQPVSSVSRITSAIVRPLGVIAHGIITAVGCSCSTLVNIWWN